MTGLPDPRTGGRLHNGPDGGSAGTADGFADGLDEEFEVPTRWLPDTGAHAEIDEDAHIEGALILSVGGAQQSHVDLLHPERIFYEYLQRIGHVVDLVGAPGEPLRVLHLGAGALTLVRYLQATRPGSEQTAVDLDGTLMDFVLDAMPLPEGTVCDVVIGDAADAVLEQPDGAFDVVVLDIFAGADAPAHLTSPDFAAHLLRVCAREGVVLVNVGDDPPLAFARAQSRQLAALAPATAVLTEAGMVDGSRAGNVVVAARNGPWPDAWTRALLAAGPHPAAVLVGPARAAFEQIPPR